MRPIAPLLFVLSVVLAGCGGSGGSSSPKRTAAQEQALFAVQTVADINRKGSKGPKFRHVKPGRSVEAEYSESLQLWTTTESEGKTTTTYYWQDMAATQPAGSMVETVSGEGYPQAFTYEQTITAGPSMGFHRSGSQTFTGPSAWFSSEVSSSADGSTWINTEAIDEDGAHRMSYDTTDKDGLWLKMTWAFQTDGSGRRTSETDTFEAVGNRNSDGTVAGSVVAKDPAESATFEVAADGTATVRYADGMSEVFKAAM